MQQTELFLRLSPDRVLQAVEVGGFRPTGHCTVLNALENRVFDLRLEDESHVVVKFYRPGRWSRDAILDEHRLLFALRDAEIPVCAPLRFDDGETLHEVEGHPLRRLAADGRALASTSSPTTAVAVLGRLLARIHDTWARCATPAPQRVARSTRSSLRCTSSLAVLEERGFLPPSCAVALPRRRRAHRRRRLRRVNAQRAWPVHRIHGDCHLGNLLHGGDGWFFLDFDDFVRGPAVQDVWMLAARPRRLRRPPAHGC